MGVVFWMWGCGGVNVVIECGCELVQQCYVRKMLYFLMCVFHNVGWEYRVDIRVVVRML